jgi:hypothetical protein
VRSDGSPSAPAQTWQDLDMITDQGGSEQEEPSDVKVKDPLPARQFPIDKVKSSRKRNVGQVPIFEVWTSFRELFCPISSTCRKKGGTGSTTSLAFASQPLSQGFQGDFERT